MCFRSGTPERRYWLNGTTSQEWDVSTGSTDTKKTNVSLVNVFAALEVTLFQATTLQLCMHRLNGEQYRINICHNFFSFFFLCFHPVLQPTSTNRHHGWAFHPIQNTLSLTAFATALHLKMKFVRILHIVLQNRYNTFMHAAETVPLSHMVWHSFYIEGKN